jgi:Protein kinase domain/AAA ATPase domain
MTSTAPSQPRFSQEPNALIVDRYELHELLGRGGMGCVYRATDRAAGREVALKQLLVDMTSTASAAAIAMFEREFHTLVQLRHPHVIEAYDYGIDREGRPFYTMELLDGGDLRDHAPMPWREACQLAFDVCSSVALLHSRRLLHRDISPPNVRRTRDGRAKLIDFGALAPMSDGGANVVGTPGFVAPEIVHRSALDARVDLFSLGSTLYYALTRRAPYPARTFAEAIAAWSGKVMAPSEHVRDIPAALDDLVLSLLAVEAAIRPQNAFEVMQRLETIAGLTHVESAAVPRAYLATPMLVGREAALARMQRKLVAARLSRGAGVMIGARAGMGRSRFLDASALQATTLGFTVMRAVASRLREPFSTAYELTKHLLESLSPAEVPAAPAELFAPLVNGATGPKPGLRNFVGGGGDPGQLQRAISAFWLKLNRKRPLFIAVDDVHRIDPESASVLAALLDKAQRAGVVVALSTDVDEPPSEASAALSRRCDRMMLDPLTGEQTRRLLGSLFGDVANLDMLAREIHGVAEGNPRQCMEVAQDLVDRGLVRYNAGTWTLPRRLSEADLPKSGAGALQARIAALSPRARFFAEAQALAFDEMLNVQDYRTLCPDVSAEALDAALSELLAARVFVADGANYMLANRLWPAAIRAGLDSSTAALRHRALAGMYEGKSQDAFIYHAFAGGLDERGLKALISLHEQYAAKLVPEDIVRANVGKRVAIYPRVHEVARELVVSLRVRNELRRWHLAAMTLLDFFAYPDEARLWLAQLERDSGLRHYREEPDTSDPTQRLTRALQAAHAAYLATPESERVYSVEEAIRLLAEYVAVCLVIGGSSRDAALLRSLPPLLEPFALLSPLLDALRSNALAVCELELDGRAERARARWSTVLPKLDAVSGEQLKYARDIANAVAFGIGLTEARLGLATACSWADRLEADPNHRIAALQLRRIDRLDHGDRTGAERYRRQAEHLWLESRRAQLIPALLAVELSACAQAGDLNGIREARERMQPLAAQHAAWMPNYTYAEACFQLVRGDYEAALRTCEACIAQAAFDAHGTSSNAGVWFDARATQAEALLALGRSEDARAVATHALEVWARHDGGTPLIELVRVLALAEARLGVAQAAERLEAGIARQLQLGVSGLRLGLSYEARARIAIWQDDGATFERYAELTAREYGHGLASTLGARYERLINEAGRHGGRAQSFRHAFGGDHARQGTTAPSQIETLSLRSLARGRTAKERGSIALQLLCASRRVSAGHLFMNTPNGLVLIASQGSTAAPPVAVVGELLARAQAHAAAIHDMETLADDVAQPSEALQDDGLPYDLLPLSCAIEDEIRIIGVAAIEPASETGADPLQFTRLLHVVALQLVQLEADPPLGPDAQRK